MQTKKIQTKQTARKGTTGTPAARKAADVQMDPMGKGTMQPVIWMK